MNLLIAKGARMAGVVRTGLGAQGQGPLPVSIGIFQDFSNWNRHTNVYQLSYRIACNQMRQHHLFPSLERGWKLP